MRDAHEALALARLQTMLTQMVWADRRGEVRAGQGQGEARRFRSAGYAQPLSQV